MRLAGGNKFLIDEHSSFSPTFALLKVEPEISRKFISPNIITPSPTSRPISWPRVLTLTSLPPVPPQIGFQ